MANPKYDCAVAFITFQLNMFVHVCSDYISNHILYVYFAYNTIILLYFISNYFLTWNDMVKLQ